MTNMIKRGYYSPESDLLIRKQFENGTFIETILSALEEIRTQKEWPWTENRLIHRARFLGIYRPEWFRAEQQRKAMAVRKAHRLANGENPVKQASRRDAENRPHFQQPVPLSKTLTPLKDGSISIARLEEAEAIHSWGVAPCDRETVAEWGLHWAGTATDIEAINAKRREWKLPSFAVR